MNIGKKGLIIVLTLLLAIGMSSTSVFAADADKDDKGTKIKVTNLSLNVKGKTLAAGKKFQIKAKITPSDATNKKINWYSTNPGVAKVNKKGLVTAVKKGKATIKATTKDGMIQKTVKIIVEGDAVKSIKLNKKNLKISWDDEVQLKATLSPYYASNQKVIWKSSDESIAKVDYDGIVWAEDTGTCYIYAISHDGSKQAKCKVTTYHTKKQLLEDVMFWTNEEANSDLGYYMDSCDVDNTNPYNYNAIYRSLKEEIKAWMDELFEEYIDDGYKWSKELRCDMSDISVSNYRPAKNSVWSGGREIYGYNGSFDFKVNVYLGKYKITSKTLKMKINTASLRHQVDWLIYTLKYEEPWLMEDYWINRNDAVASIDEFIEEWVQECVDYAQLRGIHFTVEGTGGYSPVNKSSSGYYNFNVTAGNPIVSSKSSGTIRLPLVPTNKDMRYLGKVMWEIYDYDEWEGFWCEKEKLTGADQAENIALMKKMTKSTLKKFLLEEGYSDVDFNLRMANSYTKPVNWKAVGDEDYEEGDVGVLDFEIDLYRNGHMLTVEQMEFWIYGQEYTARKWLKELKKEFKGIPAEIDLYKDEFEEFEYVLLTEDFAVPKGKTLTIPFDEALGAEQGIKLSIQDGSILNNGGFLWLKSTGKNGRMVGSNYSEGYKTAAVIPESTIDFDWALDNANNIEIWDELSLKEDVTIGKGKKLTNLGFIDLVENTMTVEKGGTFINDAELCTWARAGKDLEPSIVGDGIIKAANKKDAVFWAADTANLVWGWENGFDEILVADDDLIIQADYTESSPFVIPEGKTLTISPENKEDKEAEGWLILNGFLKVDGTLDPQGGIEVSKKFKFKPEDPVQALTLSLLQGGDNPFKGPMSGVTLPWGV